MGYSFEDIERQATATHARTEAVLGNASKSVFAQHKKAFAVLAISATVLGASFILPSSGVFKADITNPFDTSSSPASGVQTEAQDITVAPLATTTSGGTSTDASSNPFLSQAPASTSSTVASTSGDIVVMDNTAPALTDGGTVISSTSPTSAAPTEVNPFLSLLDNPSAPTATASETPESLHGSAFNLFQGDAENESVEPVTVEAVNTATDTSAAAPFKENTHTYDVSTTPADEGEAFDPAQWKAVPDAAENVQAQKSPENRFTGILLKKKSVEGYPFSYYLELDDGSKLQINTQRDLRNVYGKEITIEIDGTRENFTLKHVYYNAKKQKLVQSGPATSLALVTLFAGFGAWMLRRRIF